MTSNDSLVKIRIRYLRRKKIYAIVRISGKQFKVTPGQTVQVDLLSGAVGSDIELDKVLLIADADKLEIGTPNISGAKVNAVIGDSGKGKKVIVGKFRHKTRYKRKSGHRQDYTNITIKEIVSGS